MSVYPPAYVPRENGSMKGLGEIELVFDRSKQKVRTKSRVWINATNDALRSTPRLPSSTSFLVRGVEFVTPPRSSSSGVPRSVSLPTPCPLSCLRRRWSPLFPTSAASRFHKLNGTGGRSGRVRHSTKIDRSPNREIYLGRVLHLASFGGRDSATWRFARLFERCFWPCTVAPCKLC